MYPSVCTTIYAICPRIISLDGRATILTIEGESVNHERYAWDKDQSHPYTASVVCHPRKTKDTLLWTFGCAVQYRDTDHNGGCATEYWRRCTLAALPGWWTRQVRPI